MATDHGVARRAQSLTFVLPAYNEEARLGSALDDRGGRGAVLALLAVPHGGKGAAVKAGMPAADGDCVIFADADMATPPDQLPLLVAALRDHEVALGSQIQPDGSDMRASQPVYRRLFDLELIYLARRRGYQVAVVPIRWADKLGSRLHPGPTLAMRVAWDLRQTPLIHRRVPRRRVREQD